MPLPHFKRKNRNWTLVNSQPCWQWIPPTLDPETVRENDVVCSSSSALGERWSAMTLEFQEGTTGYAAHSSSARQQLVQGEELE